jgi:spore germination protein
MIIYVVQVGDTITSIADEFGISEARLIRENGIQNAADLVIGQTIVITYPNKVYVVEEGDTLSQIAANHKIPVIQLYRNNPFLWDRENIYPGEEIIISYDTNGTKSTSAYAFPFIDLNILRKSLPYLTTLSILNYKTLRRGEIESFYDESQLIDIVKQFGVAPLMLITSLTFRGERDPEMIYEILLNPEYQDNHAKNMLQIMKDKGYYGVNITITFLNETNQQLYLNYLKRITSYLNQEGYPVFITIDPNYTLVDNQLLLENINYSEYNNLIDQVSIMRFYWGTQYGSPMPVSSINNLSLYIDSIKQTIEVEKINVGFPLLGYNWELPYIDGFSTGNAITLDTALELARTMKATILYDEVSETPYYQYSIEVGRDTIQNIVWFVDARTINAIINLVLENGLQGTGLWNIMSYYPQLWLIINSNFVIEKLFPEPA